MEGFKTESIDRSTKEHVVVPAMTISIGLPHDLGSSLNKTLGDLAVEIVQGRTPNTSNVAQEIATFLTNTAQDDRVKLFDNTSQFWGWIMSQENYRAADAYCNVVMSAVLAWESVAHNRVHKGTPYYFWGVTAVLAGDLDKGFLLMHQALEEDILSSKNKDIGSPARWFVIADDSESNQYFKAKVDEIAKVIQDHLAKYNSVRTRTLTYAHFRKSILDSSTDSVRLCAQVFTYAIFRTNKLIRDLPAGIRNNPFAATFLSQCLLSICTVIESLMKISYSGPDPRPTFNPLLVDFAGKTGGACTATTEKLKVLNNGLNADFVATIKALLDGKYEFSGSRDNPTTEDYFVTYGFRNYGAHKIEDATIVYERFEDILQHLMNALFFTVETLYPPRP